MTVQEQNEMNPLNKMLRSCALAVAIGVSGCSTGTPVTMHTQTKAVSIPTAAPLSTPSPKVKVTKRFDAKVWALNAPDIFVVWGDRYPHCTIDYILKLDLSGNKYVNVSNNPKEVHEAMEAVKSEKALEMVNQNQPPVNGTLCSFKRI